MAGGAVIIRTHLGRRLSARRVRPTARPIRIGLFVLSVLATVAFGTPPAGASLVHWYSVAWDTSNAGNYTGISVYRYDRNIPVNGTCNSSYSAPVVYQTQWLYPPPGNGSNQIEIGTMHKTSSCKYWYGAYTLNGTFYSVWQQGGVVYDDHTFRLLRAGDGTHWEYRIDSTLINNSVVWATTGQAVLAGLETWESTVTVTSHGYYSLQYNQGGSWFNWSGRDATTVTGSMCGRWLADTTWAAAENSTC